MSCCVGADPTIPRRGIIVLMPAGNITATKDSRMGVFLAVLLAAIGAGMTAYLVLVGR
jgi:hypothetical protein